jgi:iron complex transport system substrate-binding protein
VAVQALVRNALADPCLLGVSSGASAVLLFGALAGLGTWALTRGAFLGALTALPKDAVATKVFDYDCCGDKQPLSSGHFAAPDAIIAHAGGVNVFTDVQDSWIHVSWEEVVARAPEVIAIDAADDEQARQMEDFLLGRPELAGLPAIRQHRFFVLPYANWASGVRDVDSAVALAKFLHG